MTYSVNWDAAAKTAITIGLKEVPVVGSVLSGLVSIFWPSDETNVWAEVEQQVEQLVNQALSQETQQLVQESLDGLSGVMDTYLTGINDNINPSDIAANWNAANDAFIEQLPSFQASANTADQLLLLPLFAQFANLHLSLLRDGVLFGSSWGWDSNTVQYAYTLLTNGNNGTVGITPYTAYANQIYQQGYQAVVNATQPDYHECQPFLSENTFARQMTLSVNDYIFLWQYFDTQKYPNPISVWNGREIYSDPMGTCDDSGAIVLPSSPPTQPISQIAIWDATNLIDVVQVTYPAGGGPDGETQTPQMGCPDGSTSNIIPVSSSNPIVGVHVYAGNIVNGLQFYVAAQASSTDPFAIMFDQTPLTGVFGGGGGTDNQPGGTLFECNYTGEILSSIHINGVSDYYNCADCIVLGFQFEQSQTVSLDTLQRLYITSPTSVSLDDLATRHQAKVDPDQLKQVAATKNWDAQRQEYWQHVKARVANPSHAANPSHK